MLKGVASRGRPPREPVLQVPDAVCRTDMRIRGGPRPRCAGAQRIRCSAPVGLALARPGTTPGREGEPERSRLAALGRMQRPSAARAAEEQGAVGTCMSGLRPSVTLLVRPPQSLEAAPGAATSAAGVTRAMHGHGRGRRVPGRHGAHVAQGDPRGHGRPRGCRTARGRHSARPACPPAPRGPQG